MEFVEKNFPGSVMREKQNSKMRFEFPPQESQTLAQMFGFIEVTGIAGDMNVQLVTFVLYPLTKAELLSCSVGI